VRVLIHICCAHCLAKTLAGLRQVGESGNRGVGESANLTLSLPDSSATPRLLDSSTPRPEITGLFFNPNIHPLLEFRRRLKAVKVYLERDPIPVEFDEEYGLVPFSQAIHPGFGKPERCRICYQMRLEKTAERASQLAMDAFTTTMITSRHQDHAVIRELADAAARRHGVEFLYRDLREAEPPADLTKAIYRQQYCGCVFSEADRFSPTGRYLYDT
jgi:epoxyqueuosine reductase